MICNAVNFTSQYKNDELAYMSVVLLMRLAHATQLQTRLMTILTSYDGFVGMRQALVLRLAEEDIVAYPFAADGSWMNCIRHAIVALFVDNVNRTQLSHLLLGFDIDSLASSQLDDLQCGFMALLKLVHEDLAVTTQWLKDGSDTLDLSLVQWPLHLRQPVMFSQLLQLLYELAVQPACCDVVLRTLEREKFFADCSSLQFPVMQLPATLTD